MVLEVFSNLNNSMILNKTIGYLQTKKRMTSTAPQIHEEGSMPEILAPFVLQHSEKQHVIRAV